MNREQLAEEATIGYSEIRAAQDHAESAQIRAYRYRYSRSSLRDPHDPPHAIRRKMGLFARNVDTTSARLASASAEAQRFYETNHGELYEMALEEMEADGIALSKGTPMSRKDLANEASENYSELRITQERLDDASGWYLKPDPYRSERDARQVHRTWDSYIDGQSFKLSRLSDDARKLYEDNHAELYEIAREEMEADGVLFNFANYREETVYRFDEDIAQLEEVSPLNGLGAKILHIAEAHSARIDQELTSA